MNRQDQQMHKIPAGALLIILAGCISLASSVVSYFVITRPSFGMVGMPRMIGMAAMLLHVLQAVCVIGLGIHFGERAKGKFVVILNMLLCLAAVAFVIFLRTPAAMAARIFMQNDYWLKLNVAIGLGGGSSILYLLLMVTFALNSFFANAKKEGDKALNVLVISAIMLLASLWSCFSEMLLGVQFAHVASYVLLSLGLFMCAVFYCKGKCAMKSAVPYTKKGFLRITAGMLIFALAVVLFAVEKFGLAILLTVVVVVLTVLSLRKDNAAQNLANQKIAFYAECFDGGITECKTEKEIQKATLIAQKRKIKFTDISALYYEAKALTEKDIEQKRADALDAIKNEERAKCEVWNKYADLRGRDKRIAMLTDERKDALETAKGIDSGMTAVVNATQQKEHDWATHGGIASGIAGPVAGVAVALDVQAKNAKIRQQNEANRRVMAPMMLESMKEAGYYRKKARELEQEIEEVKTKLVGNVDTDTCFAKLAFTDIKVTVSTTGTCTVTSYCGLTNDLVIFDDVKAVVDGTLRAKLYDGDALIGEATVVIPKYGVGEKAYLKGMSLFCGELRKNYTVKFEPVALWAMER